MMAVLTFFAVFFVVWWTVLFAMLPLGVRTQEEDGNVTMGTTASAPSRPHMLRTVLRTTIVSLVLMGLYYGLTAGMGWSFDDIPRLVPDF